MEKEKGQSRIDPTHDKSEGKDSGKNLFEQVREVKNDMPGQNYIGITQKIASELDEAKTEVQDPTFEIPPEIMEIIKKTRLDLSKNIPDPQALVSKESLPVCTRGNFSFVIGLPGSRKSFLCTGIAGAFLNETGCMGLDNLNGTGKLLWIDTEQAEGHVAKIGRRLHRIAKLPVNSNSEFVIIQMLREFTAEMRHDVFKHCINYYKPDFVVLDGISDLITDPNNSEQSNGIITEIMAMSKEHNCHILTVIHANIGSEKARGHLGSEALRKCETAIYAEAHDDVTLCKWVKTRDMRPEDFAFTVVDGLPVKTEYVPNETKTSKVIQDVISCMPKYPDVIRYETLRERIMKKGRGKCKSAAEKNISEASKGGFILSNVKGLYYLPKPDEDMAKLPF